MKFILLKHDKNKFQSKKILAINSVYSLPTSHI